MKDRFLIVCTITGMILTAFSDLNANNRSSSIVTVFSTEMVDGIEYGFRIPSLVVSSSGTLLAFAERRIGLHDHAQNDIVMKRSLDNGKTWGNLQVLAEIPVDPELAALCDSGRIEEYERNPFREAVPRLNHLLGDAGDGDG